MVPTKNWGITKNMSDYVTYRLSFEAYTYTKIDTIQRRLG